MGKMRIKRMVIIVFVLIIGYVGWNVYDMWTYQVTEEQLGVDGDFFNFDTIVEEGSNLTGGTNPVSEESPSLDTNTATMTKVNQEESPVNRTSEQKENNEKATTTKATTQQTTTNKTTNTTATKGKQTSGPQAQPEVKLTAKQKEEQIYNKYYPAFIKLQNVAIQKLNTLYDIAQKEYDQNKDLKDFSTKEFAAKYLSAGKRLKAEVDKKFYQLVDKMEVELKNEGLSLVLVEKAKSQYETMVKEKRKEILKDKL